MSVNNCKTKNIFYDFDLFESIYDATRDNSKATFRTYLLHLTHKMFVREYLKSKLTLKQHALKMLFENIIKTLMSIKCRISL